MPCEQWFNHQTLRYERKRNVEFGAARRVLTYQTDKMENRNRRGKPRIKVGKSQFSPASMDDLFYRNCVAFINILHASNIYFFLLKRLDSGIKQAHAFSPPPPPPHSQPPPPFSKTGRLMYPRKKGMIMNV